MKITITNNADISLAQFVRIQKRVQASGYNTINEGNSITIHTDAEDIVSVAQLIDNAINSD